VLDSAQRKATLAVPLNGLTMHLRPSELESVAAGLGQFDAGDPPAFFEALRNLQATIAPQPGS